MTLPPAVRADVEARLGPVRDARPVGGGCINPALRLELADRPVFLKYGARSSGRMFAVEARGLERLRETATLLRVPEVLALCDDRTEGPAWLALEWLEPAGRTPEFGSRLGRGLAALHRAEQPGWGWEEDGFIGSLPQPNSPAARWPAFWWERRLATQLALARAAGSSIGTPAEWDRLASRMDELLAPAEADGPSLLHGDLWSGNALAVAGGDPALVDPAAYRGHREVDLAMSELFGGFDEEFYDAYHDAWPLRPGYREVRRPVYQLYFLLVHVNLFGEAYAAQTSGTLRRILATS